MNKINKKPVLFSGIQPSGNLTIGNYIGAIRNWATLQQDYDCLFSIVDLHAITVRQDPVIFRECCYDALAINIACGLDPEKNILFAQSHVPQHSQLAWVLNCYTYMGELNRMTQFKDKSQKHAANINVGLFSYPALMAADILLYDTNLVPVGEDQTQHVELTRDIALRLNNLYGNVFAIPELSIPKVGARIMSLQEPTKKMSKSDPGDSGVIFLLDSPDVINNKLKRAVTDSGKEVRFDVANKPGVSNLLTILATITNRAIPALETEYQGCGYGKLKSDVAAAIIAFLEPMQSRFKELRADKNNLDQIFKRGADAAIARAQNKLSQVYQALGFVAV